MTGSEWRASTAMMMLSYDAFSATISLDELARVAWSNSKGKKKKKK